MSLASQVKKQRQTSEKWFICGHTAKHCLRWILALDFYVQMQHEARSLLPSKHLYTVPHAAEAEHGY